MKSRSNDGGEQKGGPLIGRMEPGGDPSGFHTEPLFDRGLVKRDEPRGAATAMPHEWHDPDPVADPHVPEEIAADVITLVVRGGGSLEEREEEPLGLEGHLDRDAVASGIMPQLVSAFSLGLEEEEEEE